LHSTGSMQQKQQVRSAWMEVKSKLLSTSLAV
jgi:hypothetical protein